MLQKLSAFDKVGPADLNKVVEYVNRITDLKVSPPLEVGHVGGGTQLRVIERGFQAAVTSVTDLNRSSSSSSHSAVSSSSSSGRPPITGPHHRWLYSVQEVMKLPNGLWQYLPNGRVITGGLHAWEWNDRQVDVGTIVYVEQFDVDDWRFFAGGGDVVSSSSSQYPDCIKIITDVSCNSDGGLNITYGYLYGTFAILDTPCSSSSSSSSGSV